MIRLSLRQFRVQGEVAVGLLLIAGVLLMATRQNLAQLYARSDAKCAPTTLCVHTVNLTGLDKVLVLMGTVLVVVPALLGAFWGAPLLSREFENGTHRLVWTQSVSRRHWLAVKVILIGTAAVAATGLLSLLVTWWSRPIDHENMNRFAAGQFGQRNIAPLGYAAFAIALGVTVGLLIRRTLAAMATTLGIYLGVRLGFTYLVRSHLLPAEHLRTSLADVVTGFGSSNGGAPSLILTPNLPNAWIFSTHAVDAQGHPPLRRARAPPGARSSSVRTAAAPRYPPVSPD